MTEALFTSACRERLNKAIKIVEERGSQYGDTLKDCQWLIMESVYNELINRYCESGFVGSPFINLCTLRALAIASLCDIKYQRFQGGWRLDNIDDGINYQSVLPEMIRLAIESYGSPEVSSRETEQSQET